MIGAEKTPATLPRARAIVEDDVPSTSRLGRYLILGLLGRGGMGVVYSAFDERLRRRVAIKRINRPGADVTTRQRSLREAQAMASLAHPNIVAVYEAFELDSRLCIVMELVAGRTLREWLAEARPSQAERLAAVMQAGRGIAAAHTAGLVHRDLKPDNIMIGDDGRVRVMDFGLARAIGGHHETLEFEVGSADPQAGATPYTGEFVGTPGYVAPEQDLGIHADARSDVFSFCVLAFEALHGRRPSLGSDTPMLAAAQDGRVTPEGGQVPAWLDAVIGRGLAVDPDGRWPTMDALLDALSDDPVARRRWLVRGVALVVFAGLLVAAVLHGVRVWREANEQTRSEAAAAARLRTVEATIARAEAAGDAASAEAAFRNFVADPEHRRTQALTQAWLARGDRRRSDATAARTAYAEAYIHARTPDDERQALRRLAGVFAGEWDGVGLGRGVDLLRARVPEDPVVAELGFQAEMLQGDLAGAATELARPGHSQAAWRPTLEHLSHELESALTVNGLVVLPGPGPARLAAHSVDGAQVVLLDGALQEVGRWRDDGTITLVPGTSWALAQTVNEARLVDFSTGVTLGRGAPGLVPIAPFDATGDGVPELFFGRRWPLYGFSRWEGLGGADARVRDAHPATDASDSTFDAHVVGDLDGDGTDELVIGFGAWRRFDLRVFRPDARGELELVTARRIGRVGGLALVRRGARRLLAVFVDNSCPAPELFPEPPHTGAAPGVHFFEWADGELAEVDFVAFPGGDGFGRFTGLEGSAVGDLDGDGREDLAFALDREARHWLMLLRQDDTGFSPLLLGGVKLLAGAQLDDDDPLELLVAQQPTVRLLALGLGDRKAPHRGPGVDVPPPPPLLADPWLVERWQRAGDLAALALTDSAADGLRDAAMMVSDRPARSVLLDRAGELLAEGDRVVEQLALEHDVHDDPHVRDRVRARRALALSRLGRHEDALAEAEALVRESSGEAEPLRIASALVHDLSTLLAPDANLELRFDAPLAPQWQIHTPGAVRRSPTRAALELEIPATHSAVAELPIEWGGGPLSFEFELDIERLEFGAGIEVALADADGKRWLGGAITGQGGGGQLQQVWWLKVGGRPWTLKSAREVPSGINGRRIHLRLTYFPERALVELMLADDGDVTLARFSIATPPAPGLQRLIIGSFADSNQASLALGELRRLAFRGARLVAAPVEVSARDHAARLLAEREPRAALAALEASDSPHPRADMLRLLALAELGDLAGLAQAVGLVLTHLDDPFWIGDLVLALRRHPVAAAALREVAGPALLPTLRSIWAFARPHRNDPRLRDEVLDGLREVERLSPGTDVERDAQRELLETRAELTGSGQAAPASQP